MSGWHPTAGWQVDPDTLLSLRLARVQRALDRQAHHLALVEVEELLDEHPHHPIGLFLAGQAALGAGDAVSAVMALRRSVAHQPQDPTVHLALAMACFESADFTESLRSARLAAQLAPQAARAWYYQGLVLERIGEAAAAQEAFDHAQELDPEGCPAPLRLTDGQWEGALRDAMRCLPTPIQAFYVQVPIRWEDFPALAVLREDFPPLSPLSGALYAGQPPAQDPWAQLPREVRLYRGNLKHPLDAMPSLVERISHALLSEALSWTGVAEEAVLSG